MTPTLLILANAADLAERTARYAAALAAPLHPRLALLHLDDYPVLLEPELAAVALAQAARHAAETMTGLRELAARLPAPTEVLEAVGPTSAAVAAALHQHQPLLLALGLHPKRGLLDELLADHLLPVLRATHLPVLLVPTAGPAPVGPPRRVLLALDGEPFAPNAAARRLAPLLASWPAAYTVAHVPGPDTPDSRPSPRVLADVRASGLLPPGAPLALHQAARASSAAAGIGQALAATQADLLVLIARPRSFGGRLFHRSVTAQVLRGCPVPVLLLPAAPEAGSAEHAAAGATAAQWAAGALAGLSPAY